MVPNAVVVVERMPINAAGKIDRQRLLDLDGERSTAEARVAPPTTATEQQVARVWRQLLGLNSVAATDHFFALGGHSLLANTMINQVNEVVFRNAFDTRRV